MKKVLSTTALIVALSLSTAVHARSAVPLIEPTRVLLPAASGKAVDAELIKQAIIKGGARRDWRVREEQPGKLTLAYNKQNKHEVVVDIRYDAAGFQISYVSSMNMKYEQKDGQAVIHPFYNKWVESLSQDIATEARSVQ